MTSPVQSEFDVVVVGGGPAGSTTGTLLKQYAPELRVAILEKASFPRPHVGESQLPPIGRILDEMGCWDSVESAGFPIKLGGTFIWGPHAEPWSIEFVPRAQFRDEPRPAPFAGQRRFTAFQVDRARYDKILLDRAAEVGCEVRQEAAVSRVEHTDGIVERLQLADGSSVRARWYVDASGSSGVLRRGFGVEIERSSRLRNIAIWDYWDNIRWAEEIGVGGTLVQIVSVEQGWIWFIPLGPTHASVGFVCPASFYRSQGRSYQELYRRALEQAARLQPLLADARPRNRVETADDWSFVARTTTGANWMLVGEAAGFADPILSAGMTLAQVAAREAAYTLRALLGNDFEADWLLRHFDHNQRTRTMQHIRFAEFFYACNNQSAGLKEFCRSLAREAGLHLNADAAWRWLAQGGFTVESSGQPALAGFDFDSARQIFRQLSEQDPVWSAGGFNRFHLDLAGATLEAVPTYEDGRVVSASCYVRGKRRLPLAGDWGLVVQVLRQTSAADRIVADLLQLIRRRFEGVEARFALRRAMQVLEVLVSEGWVRPAHDPSLPRLRLETKQEGVAPAVPLPAFPTGALA